MADTTTSRAYISGLLQSVADRGRALVRYRRAEPIGVDGLLALSQKLLKGRGEASGAATARAILDGYGALIPTDKRAFLIGAAESNTLNEYVHNKKFYNLCGHSLKDFYSPGMA